MQFQRNGRQLRNEQKWRDLYEKDKIKNQLSAGDHNDPYIDPGERFWVFFSYFKGGCRHTGLLFTCDWK
jgi:hypothetical protein